MAHAFKTFSAKPTFGTLRQNLYQSDYINRKKGVITFCKSPSRCQKIKYASSYNTINSFNIGRYTLTLDKCNVLPVNKTNLIIGQYTKQNLQDICTVQNIDPTISPHPDSNCQNTPPIIIDPNNMSPPKPFYWTYQIDPFGLLFGNSQCGELNYTNYMCFYPPNPNTLLNI